MDISRRQGVSNKPWHPLHYALKSKSDEMLKKIKPSKTKAKHNKAKKVKWKDVSRFKDRSEYEVYASGELVGRIRQEFNTKWKIHPAFEYEEENLFYSSSQVNNEYHDFREAGHALIEFWIANT